MQAVVGIERWGRSHSVGKALPFSVPITGCTGEHRGFVVEIYYANNHSVDTEHVWFQQDGATAHTA